MSEFSPQAIEVITSNLDDIRRRLSLEIQGESAGNAAGGEGISPEEWEAARVEGGTNVLLYGVPGSGKSWTIEHEYCSPETIVERIVFHPDYTNADFIGQLMPVVDSDRQITYEFVPGPFTSILKEAYLNPSKKYILVIGLSPTTL